MDGILTITATTTRDTIFLTQHEPYGHGNAVNPGPGNNPTDPFSSSPLILETGASLVLSSHTFSVPVTFTSDGRTMTLETGGSGTSGDMHEAGPLTVFIQNSSGTVSSQENFILHYSHSAISLTGTGAAIQTQPPVDGLVVKSSAPFTITGADGISIDFTASVSDKGVLIITGNGSGGSIDMKQVILMGMETARKEMNADPGTITSVLLTGQ
jgi:hypothetical protein